MKIVIDGRFWGESGIGRYLRNLIRELQKIDQENSYYILLLKKNYDQIELGKNFFKVLVNFKWYGVAEQYRLPKILEKLKPDLVHFPHFNVPLFYKGEYVTTIHDLIHQHFQMQQATTHNPFIYKLKTLGYAKVFANAVRKANRVLTPSKFVKKQLVEKYHLDDNKVIITYEAAEKSVIDLARQINSQDFHKVERKFGIKKPYLLYVGNAYPHKNLPRLIKSFNELKSNHQNLSLVLSGPEHYFWSRLKKETNVDDIIFTGYLSDRELVTLYKNAEAFVLPSLEEGFGIPILEAMACGCPVVCSKSASLPEVGGDAVVYFDPKNEIDIVSKINQLLNDKKFRQQLVKDGNKRYLQFSWKKLAQQTLEVYQKSVLTS